MMDKIISWDNMGDDPTVLKKSEIVTAINQAAGMRYSDGDLLMFAVITPIKRKTEDTLFKVQGDPRYWIINADNELLSSAEENLEEFLGDFQATLYKASWMKILGDEVLRDKEKLDKQLQKIKKKLQAVKLRGE